MKKVLLAIALIGIMPPVQANEIPGTRVLGQNAVCAPGQGRALEINVTTKEEWTYCFEIVRPTPPTVQQVEERAKTEIATAITQEKNQNAPVAVAEQTVTVEPRPITEELTKLEVNATTQQETITVLTQIEKDQVAKDRAVYEAQQAAKQEAEEKAKADQGTQHCVNWSTQGTSGQECHLDPIPATTEEVEDFWAVLQRLMSNWYEIFSTSWLW